MAFRVRFGLNRTVFDWRAVSIYNTRSIIHWMSKILARRKP